MAASVDVSYGGEPGSGRGAVRGSWRTITDGRSRDAVSIASLWNAGAAARDRIWEDNGSFDRGHQDIVVVLGEGVMHIEEEREEVKEARQSALLYISARLLARVFTSMLTCSA